MVTRGLQMSKLYHTETGHAIPTLAEEITVWRRVRKVLDLPQTNSSVKLYVMARAYPGSKLPLHISVNGNLVESIKPERDLHWWYTLEVAPELFQAGANTIELWCDSTAMNAWAIAIEPGHAEPRSFVTDDGGITWRNQRMAYLNVVRGEYLVRARLAEGTDPTPPTMVFNDPDSSRLSSLRSLLPHSAQDPSLPTVDRLRSISTWLASSWEHSPWRPDLGVINTPWDPETILQWAPGQCGHNGLRPVANCIFYGVAFANAAQAIGVPARCAIFAGQPGEAHGHFTAEWWSSEHKKWAMVDPNFDAMFFSNRVPLSTKELQQLSPEELHAVTVHGPGLASQNRNDRVTHWGIDGVRRALSLQYRSVWYRSDQLSHPEFNPPAHGGGTAYTETGIVWEKGGESTWGMFSLFGDQEYFDSAPE